MQGSASFNVHFPPIIGHEWRPWAILKSRGAFFAVRPPEPPTTAIQLNLKRKGRCGEPGSAPVLSSGQSRPWRKMNDLTLTSTRRCRIESRGMPAEPVGTKRPAHPQKQIWAIRFFLDQRGAAPRPRPVRPWRSTASCGGCDLVKLKIRRPLVAGSEVRDRAMITSGRPGDPCNLKSPRGRPHESGNMASAAGRHHR